MPNETPAISDKQVVEDVLSQMPELASLQQISEELAILAAIREAQDDIEAGRVVSHEEVKRRSALWTTK